MGRADLADVYGGAGLRPTGHTLVCGEVTFQVMSAQVDALVSLARAATRRPVTSS
jgi:hypothetical protein